MKLRRPEPQVGRRSVSSGRASVTDEDAGAARDHSSRWSRKSSRSGSAYCMSSKMSADAVVFLAARARRTWSTPRTGRRGRSSSAPPRARDSSPSSVPRCGGGATRCSLRVGDDLFECSAGQLRVDDARPRPHRPRLLPQPRAHHLGQRPELTPSPKPTAPRPRCHRMTSGSSSMYLKSSPTTGLADAGGAEHAPTWRGRLSSMVRAEQPP